MKNLIVYFILLVSSSFAQTNTSNNQWNVVRKIKVSGNQFCVDNLKNIYTYNERIIEKYNSAGKLLFTFSSTNASNITKIDVLNPLRILVFYKDINQIHYLDNTLSETGIIINLADIELEQASYVCNSANVGLWVYNPQNIELLHLNNDMSVMSKTGNLSILLQQKITPSKLFEFNNQLFLCNDKSLLVFDNFGTYQKSIPIECNTCYVSDTEIYNVSNDSLQTYHFKEKAIDKQAIPKGTNDEYLQHIYTGKNLIAISKNQELIWYEK